MKRFYFFTVTRERNPQGQLRTVLYPLACQTTYKTLSDRRHPIDVTYKVQLNLTENHKVVQMPNDVIVGVKHEGSEKNCRLSEYSRNDTSFYRTEAEVFAVDGYAGRGLERIEGLQFAEDGGEMKEAYLELLRAIGVISGETGPVASATSGVQESSAGSRETITGHVSMPSAFPTRIDQDELNNIESVLNFTLNTRESLQKLLVISQVRDRMRLGVAKFSYLKQNGDLRIAYGTRNPEIMRELGWNGGNDRTETKRDGHRFSYFDIQKRDFRCFCVEEIQTVQQDVLYTHANDMATIRNLAAVS